MKQTIVLAAIIAAGSACRRDAVPETPAIAASPSTATATAASTTREPAVRLACLGVRSRQVQPTRPGQCWLGSTDSNGGDEEYKRRWTDRRRHTRSSMLLRPSLKALAWRTLDSSKQVAKRVLGAMAR